MSTKTTIKVLGSGCPSCKKLYTKVLKNVKEIDRDLNVEYITDITKILELGVMSSPVFMINDRIIFVGRIPDDKEIKEALLSNLST